jgi:hypothetical protein
LLLQLGSAEAALVAEEALVESGPETVPDTSLERTTWLILLIELGTLFSSRLHEGGRFGFVLVWVDGWRRRQSPWILLLMTNASFSAAELVSIIRHFMYLAEKYQYPNFTSARSLSLNFVIFSHCIGLGIKCQNTFI